MYQTIKTRSGHELILPTAQENAAINAGIAADPDTYEITSAEMAQLRRPGRPVVDQKRPTLNMRVDPDVLAGLRASGKGWQTKVNALLREAVAQGKV